MKEHLTLHVGSDTTDDELDAIKESFADNFDVIIKPTIQRFSDPITNLIIESVIKAFMSIFVEEIKATWRKLQQKRKDKLTRPVVMQITEETKTKQITITETKITITYFDTKPIPKQEFYDSIDKALEAIKDKDDHGSSK